jgi:hypothetical protein
MVLILGVAVVGFVVWTTPAPGGTSNFGDQHLSTQCTITATDYGDMVSARTSWRMWSAHESPNGGYRWQARLIPTHPGLNFLRPWGKVEVDDLGTDGPSSWDGTVVTPAMSANLDWDLQVKLTWDRSNRQDANVEHVFPFDERACVTG